MPTNIRFDFDNAVSGVSSLSGFSFLGLMTQTQAGLELNTRSDVKFVLSSDTNGALSVDLGFSANALSVQSQTTVTLWLMGDGPTPLANPFFASGSLTGVAMSPGAEIFFLDSSGFAQVLANSGDIVGGTLALMPGTFGIQFVTIPSSTITIGGMNVTIACFCAGTRIAGVEGPVPVEDLRPGDRIRTADSGETEVAWLGEHAVDVLGSVPSEVNPICISAGALGEGLPKRDLWVSPDHAVWMDGVLVTAGALVNGSTVYQRAAMPGEGFTYYHVATTGGHEVILAEDLPVENFVGDASGLLGAPEGVCEVAEMAVPRVVLARMLPEEIRAAVVGPEAVAAA